MTQADRVRCFIGLPLDQRDATGIVERARAALDERDWKRHPPEDVHLTLCFLGEVERARLEPLRAALRTALSGLPAPDLVVRGTGAFGPSAAPRVLWAGVGGGAAALARLAALREASARAIAAVGLDWDRGGPFRPHMTLARARRRAGLPDAFRTLELECSWRPTAVALFASVPLARPHYPVIEACALRWVPETGGGTS